MSEPKTLHELFVDELCDAYDSEKQLTKALKKMAAASEDAELEAAFSGHLIETLGHIEVLEEVFSLLAMKPKGKHCDGIEGIIKEGEGDSDEIAKSATRDASLVGGGRRAEHYEIAAYRSMIAMGEELDYMDACALLQGILSEEEAADKKLTALGKSINANAHKNSMARA